MSNMINKKMVKAMFKSFNSRVPKHYITELDKVVRKTVEICASEKSELKRNLVAESSGGLRINSGHVKEAYKQLEESGELNQGKMMSKAKEIARNGNK